MTEEKLVPWEGDVLGRRAHADFLTSYLAKRVGSDKRDGSFTVALDAAWGDGKTFFVRNWSLALGQAEPRHIAFVFDAWEADYSTDPLVTFMAALKGSITKEIESAGIPERTKQLVKKTLKDAMKSARRALWPASKVVAAGIVKKVSGVGLDEVGAAIVGDASEPLADEALEKAIGAGRESIEKGLDTFFEKTLVDHDERATSIAEFKSLLEMSLEELLKREGTSSPMFVFIDELDRCRPSFAIALLEGIKHLFGVRGVCFVVSTNMKQLSESVRAVYGAGFDGYGYLKRFFDVQMSLPTVQGASYAKLVYADFKSAMPEAIFAGLPKRGFRDWEQSEETAFAWVAEAFVLDLRSQRQVLEMCVAAGSGIAKGTKLHFLWMVALCALRFKNSLTFEDIARDDRLGDGIVRSLREVLRVPCSRFFNGRDGEIRVEFIDVFLHYARLAISDLKDIREQASNENAYGYPAILGMQLSEEMPNSFYPDQLYRPSIASYYARVRNAGHFLAESK